jgi:CHASE3 domain sensor protein
MRKFKYNEKGITLFALIITIIVMLIISGVTINKLNKSQITSSTNIITGYSKNIVKDTDEGIKNVNNGQWGNVITSKGIENLVGER